MDRNTLRIENTDRHDARNADAAQTLHRNNSSPHTNNTPTPHTSTNNANFV